MTNPAARQSWTLHSAGQLPVAAMISATNVVGRRDSRSRWLTSIVCNVLYLMALVASLAGCTVFNPYVEPDEHRPGLQRNVDGSVVRDANGQLRSVHVSVEAAREWARMLEDAYRGAAAEHGYFRRGLDSTLIATAASALGVAVTGGGVQTAGLLGLSGVAVSMWGSSMQQAIQRQIYFQGARALECVVGAANSHVSTDMDAIALELELINLDASVRALVIATDVFEAAWITERDNTKNLASKNRPESLLQAREGVVIGINMSRFAHKALDVADPLGQILLSKVEDIRIIVDQEIAKSEPDMLHFDSALKATLASSVSTYGQEFNLPGKSALATNNANIRWAPAGSTEYFASESGLRIALHDVLQKTESVRIRAGALVANPKTYTEIFSGCSIINNIGQSPLRISPESRAVDRSLAALITATVSGGSGRFKLQERAYPEDVKAKLIGTDLTVTIGSATSANKAVSELLFVVDDVATGNSRVFSVTFVSTAVAPVAPVGADVAPAPSKPFVCADKEVEAMQIYLARGEKQNLGNTGPKKDGVDCVFGDTTRNAARNFFSSKLGLEELIHQAPTDLDVQALAALQKQEPADSPEVVKARIIAAVAGFDDAKLKKLLKIMAG